MAAKDSSTPTVDQRLENIERMLGELMSANLSAPAPQSEYPHHSNFRVSLDRVSDGRKPFKLAIDGEIRTVVTLSSVRAAILLIAFLDLQDRLEGGAGCLDMILQTQRALVAIDDQGRDAADLAENVRVGLYRTATWLAEGNILKGEHLELKFDAGSAKFEVISKVPGSNASSLRIELSTKDQSIAQVADEVLGVSPLTRLRKLKAGYFAPGYAAHDRLVMEIFDHRYPTAMHSLFSRPVSHSYPLSLLRSLGVSADRIRRAEIVGEGLRTGRIHSVEILNREALTNLISKTADGSFAMYKPHTTADEVRGHIDHIISWLETYPKFELVLTDALLPFLLGAYEIRLPDATEYFVMFYQRVEGEYMFKTGSFVLADEAVFRSVQSKILTWVLEHPTTQKNRREVIEELTELKSRI